VRGVVWVEARASRRDVRQPGVHRFGQVSGRDLRIAEVERPQHAASDGVASERVVGLALLRLVRGAAPPDGLPWIGVEEKVWRLDRDIRVDERSSAYPARVDDRDAVVLLHSLERLSPTGKQPATVLPEFGKIV